MLYRMLYALLAYIKLLNRKMYEEVKTKITAVKFNKSKMAVLTIKFEP